MSQAQGSLWLDDDDEYAAVRPAPFRPRLSFRWVALIVISSLTVMVGAASGLRWMASRAQTDARPTTSDLTAAVVGTADGTPHGIQVDVHGDVRQPGVYALVDGARLDDAVKAAGGFIHHQDATLVDAAQQLNDGQEVVVPNALGIAATTSSQDKTRPVTGGSTGPTTKHRSTGATNVSLARRSIDVNTASAATLMTLPGIGPVKAQAIIDYRGQHGMFRALTDLRHVHGIGPVTWARIEPYLFVTQATRR